MARSIARLLHTLMGKPRQLPPGKFQKSAPLGFSKEWQSIWLRQNAEILLTSGRTVLVADVKAFYEGDMFYRKASEVIQAGTYRDWESDGFFSGSPQDCEVFERTLNNENDALPIPAGRVPYRGFVFNGVDGAVVWIGVRSSEAISSRFAESSFGKLERAKCLQRDPNRVTWDRVPPPEVPEWLKL